MFFNERKTCSTNTLIAFVLQKKAKRTPMKKSNNDSDTLAAFGETRFVVYGRKDGKCFGCGMEIKGGASYSQNHKDPIAHPIGTPHFTYRVKDRTTGDVATVMLCPICAMLASKKQERTGDGTIREGEFNRNTMANCHRKELRTIQKRVHGGDALYDILKEYCMSEQKNNLKKAQQESDI